MSTLMFVSDHQAEKKKKHEPERMMTREPESSDVDNNRDALLTEWEICDGKAVPRNER